MAINKRTEGNAFETLAAEYLEKSGMKVIEKNFFCKMGEIDLIAIDENYLVFVEVKYRTDKKKGAAKEAVTFSKMRKISRTADYYIMKNYKTFPNVRFDVVAIEDGHLEHIKNAFEYIV